MSRSTESQIVISSRSRQRLEEIVAPTVEDAPEADASSLAVKLQTARTVLPRDLPEGVVDMNSRVLVRDLCTGEIDTYVVVYPDAAHPGAGRISVLAPVGEALLGCREGERIAVETPDGPRTVEIVRVVC